MNEDAPVETGLVPWEELKVGMVVILKGMGANEEDLPGVINLVEDEKLGGKKAIDLGGVTLYLNGGSYEIREVPEEDRERIAEQVRREGEMAADRYYDRLNSLQDFEDRQKQMQAEYLNNPWNWMRWHAGF